MTPDSSNYFDGQAERALLAAFIFHPDRVGNQVAEAGLTEEAFYHECHKVTFRHLSEMWANRERLDLVTLTARVRKNGDLDRIGGAPELTEIATFPASLPSMADSYIELIQEKSRARQLSRICTQTLCSMGSGEPVDSAASSLSISIAGLSSRKETKFKSMKERVLAKMDRMENQAVDSDVIKTGIGKLDRSSPMKLGDLIVVSGERKAGKSMLAITICRNILHKGGAAFYASLEQPDPEQEDRLLHGFAKIPTRKNHVSKLNEGDHRMFSTAMTMAAEWRFDLRSDLKEIREIVASIRQAKARWNDLSLAVVDYAQLVVGIRRKNDSREMEVASVSRMLRSLALELKIAIIMLSQLNKGGDARESMAIEQDMTAHWKLINENEDTVVDDEAPQVRTLTIPHQRNARSGVGFKLLFQAHMARFEELVEDRKS